MIQIKNTADEWAFDESPCDLCPHSVKCRQGEACAQFASFYKHGGRRWRLLPREPNVAQYERLFRDIAA